MAHHYGMSYREVKALPLRTFWLMCANISRLLAEKDIRALELSSTVAAGGESIMKFREQLVVELEGKTEEQLMAERLNAKRDEEGVSRLKALGGVLREDHRRKHGGSS